MYASAMNMTLAKSTHVILALPSQGVIVPSRIRRTQERETRRGRGSRTWLTGHTASIYRSVAGSIKRNNSLGAGIGIGMNPHFTYGIHTTDSEYVGPSLPTPTTNALTP